MKFYVRKQIDILSVDREQLKSAYNSLNAEIAQHKNQGEVYRKHLGKCIKGSNKLKVDVRKKIKQSEKLKAAH